MNPAPVNANKALWEKGDFTAIAALMRGSGDALARSLGITPGMRVLDLGCGDGTTAIPEAQLGADVTGVDIARNLVAAGQSRAAAAGLTNIRFEEGDACDLSGIRDRSFDLTVSIFGAMFAPKPLEVAREMVRVTKPGGRIVMGNWIPGDPTFVSQLLKVSSAYTPPPPEGFVSPMLWGVEAHVVERFAQAGVAQDRVRMEKETFRFEAPGKTPEEVTNLFRNYYGPTMNAYAAAEQNGKSEELHREIVALVDRMNVDRSGGGVVIDATFLRVTVRV